MIAVLLIGTESTGYVMFNFQQSMSQKIKDLIWMWGGTNQA